MVRYRIEMTIELPRDRVIELFDSFDNLKKWQKALLEVEHLSGDPGEPGAKTRLVYAMGKRKMVMTETILTRNLPDEFSGTYDAWGAHNINRNFFYDEGETTRWALDTEFKFSGLMRIMAFFMGEGRFQKQTRSSMEAFKAFAESA